MVGLFGQTVQIAQEQGPDVELVVFGDESYARYETKAGYTALYDPSRGLFCYAQVVDGRFESTGIPIAQPPPARLQLHLEESPEVSAAKTQALIESRLPPSGR
jgi:hypothetical protein